MSEFNPQPNLPPLRLPTWPPTHAPDEAQAQFNPTKFHKPLYKIMKALLKPKVQTRHSPIKRKGVAKRGKVKLY